MENPFEKKGSEPSEEEMELLAQWQEMHPDKLLPEEKRDCVPEVKEFEDMISAFKTEHPVEELYAIDTLLADDAPNHTAREPARLALNPINEKLNIIKEETNITPEEHDKLKAEFKYISRAVGMINSSGKVDHTR